MLALSACGLDGCTGSQGVSESKPKTSYTAAKLKDLSYDQLGQLVLNAIDAKFGDLITVETAITALVPGHIKELENCARANYPPNKKGERLYSEKREKLMTIIQSLRDELKKIEYSETQKKNDDWFRKTRAQAARRIKNRAIAREYLECFYLELSDAS